MNAEKLAEQLPYHREGAAAVAQRAWCLLQALLEAGFERDEALQIVVQTARSSQTHYPVAI